MSSMAVPPLQALEEDAIVAILLYEESLASRFGQYTHKHKTVI